MPRCCLYQLVYLRKREVVFGESFIEIGKIDVESPLVALLLYEDWVGKPVLGKTSLG